MKRSSVKIVGRSGGGKTSELGIALAEAIEKLPEDGSEGFIVTQEQLQGHVSDPTRGPNSPLYSLRKTHKLFAGYRQAETEDGKPAFWVFRRAPKESERERYGITAPKKQ